jgi:hypothetical protein
MNKRPIFFMILLLISLMFSGCVWYGGHGHDYDRHGYGYHDHDRDHHDFDRGEHHH